MAETNVRIIVKGSYEARPNPPKDKEEIVKKEETKKE
jgi:hypothetical protein